MALMTAKVAFDQPVASLMKKEKKSLSRNAVIQNSPNQEQ